MIPNTMFPTLHIAKALDVAVKRKVNARDGVLMTLSMGGVKLGTSLQAPCGGPDETSIPAAHMANFVRAFRDKGYKSKHEDDPEIRRLIPNPSDELRLLGICADITNEGITLKAMKRRAKTHIMWVCRDSKPGEYFEFKGPCTEDMRQAVKVSNPAQTILFFINDDIADL